MKTKLIDALDALAIYNQLDSHLKQFSDQLSNLFLKPLLTSVGNKSAAGERHPSLTCSQDGGWCLPVSLFGLSAFVCLCP